MAAKEKAPAARLAYRLGEAAGLLGVDPKTLTRWIRAGEIATFRPPGTGRNRAVLITHAELTAFMERHTTRDKVAG